MKSDRVVICFVPLSREDNPPDYDEGLSLNINGQGLRAHLSGEEHSLAVLCRGHIYRSPQLLPVKQEGGIQPETLVVVRGLEGCHRPVHGGPAQADGPEPALDSERGVQLPRTLDLKTLTEEG